jgi:hypothetical protein
MAPRHDEIVKQIDDGFAIAWDTTERDAERIADVSKVVEERSDKLGRIIGTGTVVDGRIVAVGARPRRRTRART